MQSELNCDRQPPDAASSSIDAQRQRLIDLLLRSTSCNDSNGALLNECCHLLDQIAASQNSTPSPVHLQPSGLGSPTSWPLLLKSLSELAGDDLWSRRIRQTASIALRLRALESQFTDSLETAKTQAIYNLAYGLSHELNNPLAIIAARAGQLTPLVTSPVARAQLENIIDSAMRGCEMLGDLMLIARPPSPRREPIDLADLQIQIVQPAERWCQLRDLQLVVNWSAVGSALLDAKMLAESVWCLLRNAIEASDSGQVIQISAVNENQHLTLRIADQGPGLSAHAQHNAFDPYFSGREAGRGLGMGLAKARRFARNLGGDVSLQNRPEGGCLACIWVDIAGC